MSLHHGYTNLFNLDEFRAATHDLKRVRVTIRVTENNIRSVKTNIDELTSFRPKPTVNLGRKLGDMQGLPHRPGVVNGILGFVAKRHWVSAVIAGTIAAGTVTFSSRKLASQQGSRRLRRNWPQMVQFQHNIWLGDEDELAEVKIAYQCMPISTQIHCVQFDE